MFKKRLINYKYIENTLNRHYFIVKRKQKTAQKLAYTNN